MGTASGQFLRPAASRLCFHGSSRTAQVPPIKRPLALGAAASRVWVPQENGARKRRKFMSYLNSVTIIGFVGSDPEQRQARNNNGSKFTVLSVATQRSWKNTDDEWASKTEWHRVCVFRPRLAEYVATTIKKGAHVLVEGSLVSTSLDLSALSPVRGAESATGTQRRVPVPSSPLALTLTLPLASPEGHYDLNLTSGSETVWSKSA